MPIGFVQGPALGPLLFLLYINDLNLAIKYYKVHHFADDTNLLYTNNFIKNLNKMLDKDLKNLTNWLNANKIPQNFNKTELILFKPKMKKNWILILNFKWQKILSDQISKISRY